MILLGTSDAGPAKYIIELCRHYDLQFFCVGNYLTCQMFSEKGLALMSDWRNSKPLLVVTGTSLGSSLDKEMTKWARENKIPSISLIEHWSWYLKRFKLNGEFVWPDFIFVNDKIAQSDAIDEGLPPEKLIIVGNPVLESLSRCSAQTKISRVGLLQKYHLPNKRIIVFISEELACVFNKTEDDLGYDEFIVLKELMSLLQPSDHLIIKLHPEEADDKYQHLLSECVSTLRVIDIYSLSKLASVVIGMASMLLLELAILRDDIISFRPNATKNFIGKRLCATIDATSNEELKGLLEWPQKVEGEFSTRFGGSSAKIVSLIKAIIK
jgi:hypothetical protein